MHLVLDKPIAIVLFDILCHRSIGEQSFTLLRVMFLYCILFYTNDYSIRQMHSTQLALKLTGVLLVLNSCLLEE